MVAIGCYAESVDRAVDEANEAVLQVRPDVCLITPAHQSCDVDITINWRAIAVGDYCVTADESRLACWEQQREGVLVDQRSLQRSFEYQLRADNSSRQTREILARTKVVVVAARSSDKRRNRRRRHVWSVL